MATKVPKFRYLSAWFCPFAHRTTIALEHHAARIEYEWVEALGWEQRADERNVTGTGKEWWYHWKADELKEANPSALVPTLIPVDDEGKAMPCQGVHPSLSSVNQSAHSLKTHTQPSTNRWSPSSSSTISARVAPQLMIAW